MELSDYGMSRERGYLSHYEIDEIVLPSQFDAVKQAAGNLSGLLSTGRVRHWLGQLADPGLEDWAREAGVDVVRYPALPSSRRKKLVACIAPCAAPDALCIENFVSTAPR